MNCSCHAPMVYSAETYVGTQIYADRETGEPYLVLALHNCQACGSTRAAILFDATGDEDEKLEPIAAE